MYIYLNVCKQMNNISLLVTLQYLKLFDCVQTND